MFQVVLKVLSEHSFVRGWLADDGWLHSLSDVPDKCYLLIECYIKAFYLYKNVKQKKIQFCMITLNKFND